MKFTHGVWSMREGVSATPLARVLAHEFRDNKLYLECVNRADPRSNLNNYGFKVVLSSPFDGAIRVQVAHRTGRLRPGPDFVLTDSGNASSECRVTGASIEFSSGSSRVVIGIKPFSLAFFQGEQLLTRSKDNQLARMQLGEHEHMLQRLSLDVGESVYGLGERFGPLVRNGQSISIWNEDPGTETDLAYKNVPFYVTSRGYGVFVNSPGKVDFEVATERVFSTQFSVPGHELDYFVFAGDPKSVLEKYTRLTGRAPIPPAWSFGLWLSTSFLTNYDEKIVGAMIDGMHERQIPLSVFHFDCLWMKEHHWCDFEWDKDKFPDPAAMLARLKSRGIKICVWINPYISELSKLFNEGRDAGYFVKDRSGGVYQRDDWQPQIALVDFTRQEAVRWYQSKLSELLDMGVDCFKTDFGERIPADAVYHDGSDPERMHNYYSYLYNQAVHQVLVQKRGADEAVVFARSATAGCQKFPVHWGGDCDATFESMAETLRGGLSFGLSGGAFWSHDISGFNATATPALYKRWVAFGLLSSHSRLHGSTSYRVPWEFDQESVEVLRHFTRLKMRLMPYLMAAAKEANESGLPLLRAMVLEFPNDPAVRSIETQYMLGADLLVAPVFNPEGRVSYYLPRGEWIDFDSGEVRVGERWYEEAPASFFRIPLFVRRAALLPLGNVEDRPDYPYTKGLTLEHYGPDADAESKTTVPTGAGAARADGQRSQVTFSARREGNRLTFTADGGSELRVLVRHAKPQAKVQGGKVLEATPRGLCIAWESPSTPLVVTLE